MFLRKTSTSIAFVVAFVAACAPPAYRTHPQLQTRQEHIETVALAPCDAKVYSLSAGGVPELRDDWCGVAKMNIEQAIREELADRAIVANHLKVDTIETPEFEEIAALYRAVSSSILQHAYGPQAFPSKQTQFDYSIGPIADLLAPTGTDVLIFAYGLDHISTGGRKALMFLGVLAGAVTGVVVTPAYGTSIVSIAMVDSSGAILWHSVRGGAGNYDLRDPDSARSLVRTMFSDFPR